MKSELLQLPPEVVDSEYGHRLMAQEERLLVKPAASSSELREVAAGQPGALLDATLQTSMQFRALGHEAIAERLLSCGLPTNKRRLCTPGCGNHLQRFIFSCNLYRVCPECGEKRNKKHRWLLFHLLQHFRNPRGHEWGLRLLTLTIVDGRNLMDSYQHLRDSLTRLYRSKWWQAKVKGWVCGIETKPTAAGTYHVHAHMVVYSRFLDNQTIGADSRTPLSRAWEKASKDSYIVDVRKCDTYKGGVQYILKYVTKPMEGATPQQLAESHIQLKNKKLFSIGGVAFLYTWKHINAGVNEARGLCHECGNRVTYKLDNLHDLYELRAQVGGVYLFGKEPPGNYITSWGARADARPTSVESWHWMG